VACRVVNKGIGGERTDQALKRLDAIIKLKPRLVTVMYGTNDSYVDAGKTSSRITVDEYRDNLQKIVQRLLVEGIEPVLMTEPRWAADAGVNGSGEHPTYRLSISLLTGLRPNHRGRNCATGQRMVAIRIR
jgi:hypothetical protein